MAFITTIFRHIKEGSFFESMLWFSGTFAVCFLIVCLILILLKKHFSKEDIGTAPVAATSELPTVVSGKIDLFKYGKTALGLVIISVVILVLVGAIKWHQHLYIHRMKFILPRFALADAQGLNTSCYADMMIQITNAGPDSMPFDWKIQMKMPSGNHFDGQAIDWEKWGLGPRVGWLADTNDLLAALSKEPVRNGTEKSGVIVFFFLGVPKIEIPFGTKFIVSCQDGQGHLLTAITAWNGPVSPSQ